ncbi:5-oxoprolinase [candidate division LCP-89 bacterium B3_LCP]|uniref:5-oxoprolinase n=1 Tax=candidate division LCP-89 bacterium B3_LCP TaxID=2012998 RepID=A0A532V2Q9_UNCL8|nr:MAG: 5-oxoprolinase [candidate division LCP-89 bacterium B3_LCP]
MRIGIDVGGTFTDIVGFDDDSGQIHYAKTLTTPHDLTQGVIQGINDLLSEAGIEGSSPNRENPSIQGVVHGTTIGTNALIEKKGALTGLITTEGFRDVLEIGRVQRPPEALYDFTVDNPPPLVPRFLRLEVKERVGADGSVVVPLDGDSVRKSVRFLKEQGVKSIAVCLLFSFLNDNHEKRVADIITAEIPDAFVTLSSIISPEFREYERTSTTVLNAYLLPIIKKYLDDLSRRLKGEYLVNDLRIMQASGGSMTVKVARERAINTVNSGPAGGALAGAFMGSIVGEPKLITVDMGGTSFDIGLVEDGKPKVSSDGVLEDYPAKIPMVNIYAIGAGGGSLARVEPGGVLEVGPQSAGADPGPVCYGHGGQQPTVTDANLVLGRLNPDYFLGGRIHLEVEAAKEAMQDKIASPMGLTLEETAAGILRVINAKMAKGITTRTTQKGLDIREFALMAFGGAGALHAAEIAEELGMTRVVVPPYAGNLSALGLLVADARHDYTKTIMLKDDDLKVGNIAEVLEELQQEGYRQLHAEGIPDERASFILSADLRLEGQSYDLNVVFPDFKGKCTRKVLDRIVKDFHRLHEQVYAFKAVDEVTEWVNLRVTAIGHAAELNLPELKPGAGEKPRPKRRHQVYFFGKGFKEVPVYERSEFAPGDAVKGPCLIEEIISTTVLPPGWDLAVDKSGCLLLNKVD